MFASGLRSISLLPGPLLPCAGINPSYAYVGIILTQQGPSLFVCKENHEMKANFGVLFWKPKQNNVNPFNSIFCLIQMYQEW